MPQSGSPSTCRFLHQHYPPDRYSTISLIIPSPSTRGRNKVHPTRNSLATMQWLNWALLVSQVTIFFPRHCQHKLNSSLLYARFLVTLLPVRPPAQFLISFTQKSRSRKNMKPSLCAEAVCNFSGFPVSFLLGRSGPYLACWQTAPLNRKALLEPVLFTSSSAGSKSSWNFEKWNNCPNIIDHPPQVFGPSASPQEGRICGISCIFSCNPLLLQMTALSVFRKTKFLVALLCAVGRWGAF